MIHLRLDSSAPQSLAAMANASLQIPKGVRDEALQLLKNKSHEFVKEHFMAPDKKRMIIWLKKKMPEEYWSEVKYLVKRFRKSMPIEFNPSNDLVEESENPFEIVSNYIIYSFGLDQISKCFY